MDQRTKQKILTKLRQQPCEDSIEAVQRLVLERMVESDLALDLIGTIVDESGSVFFYSMCKAAFLSEFFDGELTGILVSRTFAEEPTTGLYIAHKLNRGCVLSEEEKQLFLKRLEKAFCPGGDVDVGKNARN